MLQPSGAPMQCTHPAATASPRDTNGLDCQVHTHFAIALLSRVGSMWMTCCPVIIAATASTATTTASHEPTHATHSSPGSRASR